MTVMKREWGREKKNGEVYKYQEKENRVSMVTSSPQLDDAIRRQ